MLDLPWNSNTPPDHVNDIGTKFWVDLSTTDYARRKNDKGKVLPNVIVYFVETAKGERTRLLCNGNTPVADNQSLEAICVRIDLMKAM